MIFPSRETAANLVLNDVATFDAYSPYKSAMTINARLRIDAQPGVFAYSEALG